MRLKYLALVTSICVASVAARSMHADTLNLVSVTGPYETVNSPGGSGTEDAGIYPYNFSIDGSSTLTPLMCITMNNVVGIGESWTATELQLNPNSQTAYLEDAWIFSQMGNTYAKTGKAYTNSEVQFAVWDVLDSSDASTDSEFDAAAKYLVNQAYIEATTQGDLSASFLSQFTIYVPNGAPSGYGMPQTYIGDSPTSLAPEPSSLLLMGTGLLAAAALTMRRRSRGLLAEL